MIRVEQRQLQLAQRIAGMTGTSDTRQTAIQFLLLGLAFHAAWLSGMEMRAGATLSPFDQTEYDGTLKVLEELGWSDLLDA